MLRKRPVWIMFCILLCWQVSTKADEPTTVDEVIARYLEAIGGRDKLDAVKSMKITGKMLVPGGMEIPMTMEIKRPNKMRIDFTVQGMTGTQAYDGKIGWSVMPFAGKTDPEKMSPDMVKLMENQADIDGPLVDYKKKGHKVELIGKEDLEGTEVYKLKVTKKGGDVEYYFLDAEYFLPIKVKGKWKMMGSEVEFETTLGDYKEVNGLLLPHSVEQRGGDMGPGSTISFEKVELNVDIADDRFVMPEVKKEAPKTEVEKEEATPHAQRGRSFGELIIEKHEFEAADGERVDAEKGRFRVPENRKRGTGKQIELAFVRFKSTNPKPGSPIVYLAGGPGGAGTDAARGSRFPLFMAFREVADVIAFDQRGTGMSHQLPSTPRSLWFPTDKPVTRAEWHEAFRKYAAEAADHWRAQGVDLDAYNTEESADDLEDLRRAIGAEKITLWGISYGTHLALATIKRHESSIDRVILAGVEGPDQTVKLPHQQQALLKKIDALIKADPEASQIYPDFLGGVQQVLARLEEQPAVWKGNDGTTYALSKFELRALTAGFLRGPSQFRTLPKLYRAMQDGDFTALSSWMLFVKSDRLRAMSSCMDAASGISPQRQALIDQERKETLLGDAINFPWHPMVEGIRVADLGEVFRTNPHTRIPALFISGTLDGRTPPENAEEILKGFPNGKHLVIDGAGHSDPLFLSSPRILEVMLAFLKGEAVEDETIKLPPVEFPKKEKMGTGEEGRAFRKSSVGFDKREGQTL